VVTSGQPAEGVGRARSRAGAAFTLIELLVVIAIISVLLSVSMPSLRRARVLAERTSCAANLKALGSAAAMYDTEYQDYVPICWGNLDPNYPHPWKSWRSRLLDYVTSYEVFNCPGGEDTEALGEVFHCDDEITGFDQCGTVNAGSYGVMEQFSLPSFTAVNSAGLIKPGHPVWTNAFPTTPGVAWQDPFNSVYVADSCMCKGPVSYPSQNYAGSGSSVVRPPSQLGYFLNDISRRFADRHLGTNCLFLGGHVLWYETGRLDGMVAGEPDCVWDVE
jgi:prepilin-type N-terminal cleavage/methylation domain-containing protein